MLLLTPEEVVRALDDRLARVRATLERLEEDLAQGAGIGLPRITLLETEYLRATTRAEADWLGAVLDDLRAGRLVWSTEQLIAFAQGQESAEGLRTRGAGQRPSAVSRVIRESFSGLRTA